MNRPLTIILLFMTCLVLSSLFIIRAYIFSPLNGRGSKIKVTISQGQNFASISKELHNKGILHHPRLFTLLGKILGKEHQIKAGEFIIDSNWNRLQLLKHLTQGQEVLYKLVLPEGLTWWQTAKLIDQNGLASFADLKQAIFDQTLLQGFKIPAPNAEGYLFPQTYLFPHYERKPAQKIVSALIRETLKQCQILAPGLDPKKRHQILILASMVEKETARHEERPIIAGVFVNRLKKRMLLQCDPTVIYGLGPGFDGNLTKKDLRDKTNPYNTYIHPGLPPGPICSPGLPSIQATLHPGNHAYLYFVATGQGKHAFSKTLAQHLRLVRRYQGLGSR